MRYNKKDKDKIFIPKSIDRNFKDNIGSMTPKRLTLFFILSSPVLIITIIMILATKSVLTKLIILIVASYIVFFIVRKVLWQEKLMISVLQEEVDNKILNLQNIWNIFDIESNTGIIKYTDGYSQAIIFLDRGSIIGKSKDFETIHKNSVANIIRYFISNGYEIRFDSKINRKADDSAILYLEKFANKLKSKGLNLRNRIQISYMKKFSRRVSYTEEDYIIVRTNKRELLPNMYEDIKGIESEVQNSSYVDYKVLNKTEALEFIAINSNASVLFRTL